MKTKDKFYKQCTFKSDNSTTTAWIPERGAKVGKRVTFKDDDSDQIWTVVSVGAGRIPKDVANKRQHQNKTFVDGPQEMKRRR